MGADLYIHKIYDPQSAKYQPLFDKAVELRDSIPEDDKKLQATAQKTVELLYGKTHEVGYFRDSYNTTSVLWTLGLSWWKDIGEMLDDDGNMQPEKIREFLALVKNADQRFPTAKELIVKHCVVDDKKKNGIETWHKMYADARKELVEFLEKAIELNEPISCSI